MTLYPDTQSPPLPDAANYLSYLLRVWRPDPSTGWRALLVDPRNGEKLVFSSLDDLFRFLKDQTEPPVPGDNPPDEPGNSIQGETTR